MDHPLPQAVWLSKEASKDLGFKSSGIRKPREGQSILLSIGFHYEGERNPS
jgi:hypothetical protein